MSSSSAYKAYSDLPLFSDFASVADTERYVPLPDDWFVALTDVVKSTEAIRDGRYKAVNMAGAAAIAAIINALDGDASFPFIFGGDGTALALPESSRETAEAATDTDVPFFAVLLLSGAIATRRLARANPAELF